MSKIISLDVGGSKILGGLFNEEGEILERVKVKTFASKGRDLVLSQIKLVIDELSKDHTDLSGIAANIPGIIEDNRRVVTCPNVPIEDFDLSEYLKEEYNVEVLIGNDVSLAIYGEWHHLKEKPQNVVGLFLGTGVGGGLIINGHLYEGQGGAGEIGHMIIQPRGRRCGCGNEGCVEAYASKAGMLRQILAEKERGRASSFYQYIPEDGSMIKGSAFTKALAEDDELTKEVLDEAAYYLGLCVASLANILHVDEFIFGGGMTDNVGDYILPKALTVAKRNSMPFISDSIVFNRCSLGDDAGILGGYHFMKEEMAHA